MDYIFLFGSFWKLCHLWYYKSSSLGVDLSSFLMWGSMWALWIFKLISFSSGLLWHSPLTLAVPEIWQYIISKPSQSINPAESSDWLLLKEETFGLFLSCLGQVGVLRWLYTNLFSTLIVHSRHKGSLLIPQPFWV